MDLDDLKKRAARKSHWTQRWLREVFVEDLGLKILALLIALALWYGVTGQRTPTTIRVPRVPLNFRLPNGTEIGNEPRLDVEVTLTGTKRALDGINVRDLTANVDVSDLKPDEHNVQLTMERVTMGLPDGVRLVDIQPNNVSIRLEPRIERELDIDIRTSGTIAEGHELLRIVATPEKIKVRGPASHVGALQKARTENISLDGRKESFTIPQASIEITDKKVDLLNPTVDIRVEIEERRVLKTFTGVAVQALPGAPPTPLGVTVQLFGPPSLLERLRSSDFQIALEQDEDGKTKPRLIIPQEMSGRIELRSFSLQ